LRVEVVTEELAFEDEVGDEGEAGDTGLVRSLGRAQKTEVAAGLRCLDEGEQVAVSVVVEGGYVSVGV
jgi:hypothetical protein